MWITTKTARPTIINSGIFIAEYIYYKTERKRTNNQMKLTFNLIALVVILNVSQLFSQMTDNWKWLNPSPQGNTLYSIDFIDNNTGFTTGEYGTILRTTNAGSDWEQLVSGTNRDITAMDFADANTGYIGGRRQYFSKTTNAGLSWQQLTLPVQGNWDTAYTVMDIQALTPQVIFAAGFFQLESKIWKSTNGGASWEIQSTGSFNYIQKLYFIDQNTGFAMGGALGGEIIRTSNGGASWLPVFQESYTVYSMSFISPTVGIAGCESGRVYRTTDAGLTWNFALSPSGLDINSIQFINSLTGYGFGTGSVYVKTTDGGLNWDEIPLGTGGLRLYFDAAVTPNGNLHAAGSYGALIRSTNSGNTFLSQPYVTENSLTDIEFINSSTGYAVAGFGAGDILKTTDAGETWVSQISSYTLPMYGISFTGAETGYLAGSINIKKTTNGGVNWTDVYTSTTNEIFGDIYFTNPNTGYAVGSYARLLKTTNAGATWNSSTIPGSGTFLNSVFFVDENTGYTAGDNKAHKTTDAGATWQELNVTGGFPSFNNIFFTDANTGYISSGTGIFKSTNGGTSWFQLSTPAGGYNCVQFRNNFGYAVGGDGKIIKSADGGNSWIVQPTVTENSLYALYFNGDNFVYAGGVRGTLIKTIPAELLLTPVSGTNGTPKTFSLGQNYPNPFNPVTNIRFSIPTAGAVSLSIFDITGRKVTDLINGVLNAGSHEVTWNASQFSSGVYFFTLKTAESTETRKMTLVK